MLGQFAGDGWQQWETVAAYGSRAAFFRDGSALIVGMGEVRRKETDIAEKPGKWLKEVVK